MRFLRPGLLLLAAACSSPSVEKPTAAPAPATGSTTIPAKKTLPEAQVSKLFSNAQRPDKFRLQLLGASTLTATAHFSIVTAAGDTVWSERFPAARLIDGYGPEPATDEVREALILKRLHTFFEPSHFPAAAIAARATFDPHNNGSRPVWREVQQRQAPGFRYTLGEENSRVLGYSARLRKAAAVYTCC